MKPPIAVLYSLARSGSTLISRCLACIPGNTLLSEIHPRWALFNPLSQAAEWFNLVSRDELRAYSGAPTADYLDAISLISERCLAQGRHLIIRDWTQIDFIPGRYPVPPTYRLSQHDALQEHFEIHPVAVVRDPLDSYLSLTKLPAFRGWLSLPTYLAGFRLFTESVSAAGFLRYEDFCDNPASVTKAICEKLNVNYDAGFLDRYHTYANITGDVYTSGQEYTLTGDRIAERAPAKIQRTAKRPEYRQLLNQAKTNDDYIAIVNTLGYPLA